MVEKIWISEQDDIKTIGVIMSMDVHFSSESNEWRTPKKLFDKINEEHHFELDAAATKENSLCEHFYTIEDDALKQDWSKYKSVWCNPPYGRLIGKFVKKAYEESEKGCLVFMLIPARPDTKWWHEYCSKGFVWFIKGRLKFYKDDVTNLQSAPFPSALIKFDKYTFSGTVYITQDWNT